MCSYVPIRSNSENPTPRLYPFAFNPLYQSLKAFKSEAALANVVVMTSSSCLRYLAAFLEKDRTWDFRIDIELVGNMLVLMRAQKSSAIDGITPGCGKGFEEASTTQEGGILESPGYYRVARYDLMGLPLLVQNSIDAYDGDAVGDQSSSLPIPAGPSDDADPTTGLGVTPAGANVARAALVRSRCAPPGPHPRDHDSDVFQSYFGQSPILFQGLYKNDVDGEGHANAVFEEPDISKCSIGEEEWKRCEKEYASTIAGVVEVLKYIQSVVTHERAKSGSSKFAAVYDLDEDAGKVKIYHREGGQEAFSAAVVDAIVRLQG